MSLTEVAVDLDGKDIDSGVQVEEPEIAPPEPPDGGEKDTPEVKEEPTQDAVAEPQKTGELDELEKIKRDRDALGYRLRTETSELRRQMQFLEEQLRQEKAKIQKREIDEATDKDMARIEHLKDVDPDTYIAEARRIMEVKVQRQLEEDRRAIETNLQVMAFSAKQQQVEERLVRDFPDIVNGESELFKEAQVSIKNRYTDQEIAYLQANAPQVFYDIVSETAARIKLKKVEASKADQSRQQRVNSQGVVESKPKNDASGESKLTKEQLVFCRKNGFDPKEYAKFVGRK